MGNKAPGINTNTMMFFGYSEQAHVMVGIIITPLDTRYSSIHDIRVFLVNGVIIQDSFGILRSHSGLYISVYAT